MYLALIEARYDYQLSYLDQWAKAWKQVAEKTETFNIVRNGDLKKLQQKSNEFDLLVVLHSVTADSNSWLKRLSGIGYASRAPMILFVGNEFSSPFLSTELRLKLISEIAPEIIASQLPIECARWLYEKTGSRVVAAPPGLPDVEKFETRKARRIDFGYRGFPYPWYLLDEDRNETVESVSGLFRSLNKKIDISFSQRFDSAQWFQFLKDSSFTASSEAGSRYVFRDDEIWRPVQEYFLNQHKFSAVSNDAAGMNLLRQLPGPLKRTLKKVTSTFGVKQASLFQPDSHELETLQSLVDPTKHDHRDGKAISSRHFDAFACGTWQILKPGRYNGILDSTRHFTKYSKENLDSLIELISNPALARKMAKIAVEDLSSFHTYRVRVSQCLDVMSKD